MHLVAHGGTIAGTVEVPGDKSISHRAVLIAALANGPSGIDGFLEAGDTLGLLDALEALGIGIERLGEGRVTVHGRGAADWASPARELDLGNSGTALRLLAGVLAGRGVDATLAGDASLNRRPTDRIVEPLRAMGAAVRDDDGHPPLHVSPAKLRGIHWRMPVASAQVKSCLLFAGLHAGGLTTVVEPAPTRDHTEHLLERFGIRVARNGGETSVQAADWGRVSGVSVSVPRDPSAAAFFAVGAAITRGGRVRIPGICVNPRRTGFLRILERMGAEVQLRDERQVCNEPVADLEVAARPLRGVEIGLQEVVDAIDELPVLMIAAACADGATVLRGAGELRHKESDRIDAIMQCLSTLGIETEPLDDGLVVHGGKLQGGRMDAHGDHRIAMAAAVASLGSGAPVEIHGADAIATSFPGFASVARAAGLVLEKGE